MLLSSEVSMCYCLMRSACVRYYVCLWSHEVSMRVYKMSHIEHDTQKLCVTCFCDIC